MRNTGLVATAVVVFALTTRRTTLAQQHLRTAQRQSAIAQLDDLGGRSQNAAEMLSSKLLPARIGGIHSLDQLARDYPEEFHVPVV